MINVCYVEVWGVAEGEKDILGWKSRCLRFKSKKIEREVREGWVGFIGEMAGGEVRAKKKEIIWLKNLDRF